MLNINEFKSAVEKNDLERPNLFAVTISVPGELKIQAPSDNLITLFCRGANLPGVALNLVENLRYGIGPSVKMPFRGAVNDITLTFLADSGGKLHSFFQDWIGKIYPMYGNDAFQSPGSNDAYLLQYKKNYQTTMKIDMYRGESGKYTGSGIASALLSAASAVVKVPFVGSLINGMGMRQNSLVKARTYEFFKAYPTNIGDVSLSHINGDVVSEFTVGFTFQTYKVILPTK